MKAITYGDGQEGDDELFGGDSDDFLIGCPGADGFACGDETDTITEFSPVHGDFLILDRLSAH